MIDLRKVPFNKPFLVGIEIDRVQQAAAAMHLSGDGTLSRVMAYHP